VVAAGVLTAAALVLCISASASASPAAWPTCLGQPATIVGTDGNDTITGTDEDDVIVGLAGDDQILGNGGWDLICGGDGNDTIIQNDRGFYNLAFAAGDAGDDTIQAVRDALVVADYQESPAAATVDLGAGTATGNGTDTLIRVHGAWGSSFDDTLTGSPGEDYLLGDDGNDTLSGLAGSDMVEGDPGNDILDGGTGHDRAWYGDSATAVRVNLAKGTGTGEGSDQLKSIEDIIGSRYGDVLVGSPGANAIWGGRGKDRLYGGGGRDRLSGESGKDFADGGPARDVCVAEKKVRCP
jgi:Ca2+-binding RTX toxin-like protein